MRIPSGSKWEDIVGYSRVAKIGNIAEVAGTTAVDDNGNVVAPGNAYKQTQFMLLQNQMQMARK